MRNVAPIKITRVEKRNRKWVRLETGEPLTDDDRNKIYWADCILRPTYGLNLSMTEYVTLIDAGLLEEYIEYRFDITKKRRKEPFCNSEIVNLFDFVLSRADPLYEEFDRLDSRMSKQVQGDAVTVESAMEFRDIEYDQFLEWKQQHLAQVQKEAEKLSAAERAKLRWGKNVS